MNNKPNPFIIISASLFGLILVALGVIIGQAINPQHHITLLPSGEGDARNDGSILEFGGTISVQGDSEIWVKPDIAILSVGIVACSSDTREANRIINDSLANITNRLVETGIPEEDIVPSSFSLSPDYNDTSRFCAANNLDIVTEDFEQISELLDLAIEAGATNVHSIKFTVKDTSIAREEAIDLAYELAVQQAEQTADLLGYSLGNVIKSDVQIRDSISISIPGHRGGGGAVAPQSGKLQASVELIYAIQP